MIYIFRQYDSDKQIIIYAESYIEAKETLFEFNPWADKTYNIFEYKMYNIDTDKFWKVLNIDENGYGYPRILSKKEYEILRDNKVILDEQFKNLHNTRVLMKKDASEDFPLLSTEEFVNKLKNHANIIDKHKQNVYQMLNIVGDIWFEEIFDKYAKFNGKYIIYGKSRYQCKKLIEKLNEQYKSNRFTSYNRPETLIENNYVDDLTPRDIERYDKMVGFMKANNIKKFPFTTYIEEES
jgi:hypothetical protein